MWLFVDCFVVALRISPKTIYMNFTLYINIILIILFISYIKVDIEKILNISEPVVLEKVWRKNINKNKNVKLLLIILITIVVIPKLILCTSSALERNTA